MDGESEQQPEGGEIGDSDGSLFADVTHDRKRAFLNAFASCGHVAWSVAKTKVSRATVYYWKKHDKQFSAKFEEAQLMAADKLTDAARVRAIHGVKRVKFDKDGTPYYERHYSDVLLMFLLKNLDPARYGDKAGDGAHTSEIVVRFEDEYTDNPNYQADATASANPIG